MTSKPDALAIIPAMKMSDLTSSVESFQLHIPTVDEAKKLSVEKLHVVLLASIRGTLVCYSTAKVLIFAAKLKMHAGIPVGGCLNFTGIGGYIDLYVREEGQTLEVAVRKSYRLLDGLGISEKFDGSKAREAKKKAADEKAKRIQDRKDAKAKDAAARIKLDEAAAKAKSIQDKTYIETLEAEIDYLKKSPSQAEAASRPTPVNVAERNPVNATVAMRDANDPDAAVLILRYLAFAITEAEKAAAMKTAIKFLKRKSAFFTPYANRQSENNFQSAEVITGEQL